MSIPNFWVYILICKNNSFYVGYTTDLIKRFRAHANGTAAKYTRSFPPLSVAQVWPIYGEKHLAMRIERFIKGFTKEEKHRIVADPSNLEQILFEQSDF